MPVIRTSMTIFLSWLFGFHQHCQQSHLHRYLAEFDFRFNRRSGVGIHDTERHDMLLARIGGKRLTYRRIGEARHA